MRYELVVDAEDNVEFVQISPGRYAFIASTREVTELNRNSHRSKGWFLLKSWTQRLQNMGFSRDDWSGYKYIRPRRPAGRHEKLN